MKRIVGLLLLGCSAAVLKAQSFSIDWFTTDGGGGTSAGGVFALSGTIGQPEAGSMNGGNFTVQGGFWSVTIVQDTNAPLLHVTNGPGGVVIYWERPATGFVLEQTPTLIGSLAISWNPVPFPYQTNATHISVTIASPSGHAFYRLHRPE